MKKLLLTITVALFPITALANISASWYATSSSAQQISPTNIGAYAPAVSVKKQNGTAIILDASGSSNMGDVSNLDWYNGINAVGPLMGRIQSVISDNGPGSESTQMIFYNLANGSVLKTLTLDHRTSDALDTVVADCFTYDNENCIQSINSTSSPTNGLAYWAAANTLGATTSPIVGYITATSSTATSSFAGNVLLSRNLFLNNGTGQSQIRSINSLGVNQIQLIPDSSQPTISLKITQDGLGNLTQYGQNMLFSSLDQAGFFTFDKPLVVNSGSINTLSQINTGVDIGTTSSKNNLRVSGTTTTQRLVIPTITSSILSTDANGNVVATTTSGSSLSGGSTNFLTYWTGASTVGATSSPVVGYITATSTTGTSTFTNANFSGAVNLSPVLIGTGDVFSSYPASTTITRNNYTGSMGFRFQVAQTITISQLGREWPSSGSSNDHNVALWNGTGPTLLASTTVLAASASDSNNVKWGSITPVTLTPGITYALASDETNGGDKWKDSWDVTSFINSSYITNIAQGYSNSGTSGVYPANGSAANTLFGTPTMKFTLSSLPSLAVVGVASFGTTTQNGTVFITPANNATVPLTITGAAGQTVDDFTINAASSTGATARILSVRQDTATTSIWLSSQARPTRIGSLEVSQDYLNTSVDALYVKAPIGGRMYFGGINTNGARATISFMNFADVNGWEAVPERVIQVASADTNYCPGYGNCSVLGTDAGNLVIPTTLGYYIQNVSKYGVGAPGLRFRSFAGDGSYQASSYPQAFNFEMATSTANASTINHTDWTIQGVKLMSLTPTGKLGIGSSTPIAPLSVVGYTSTSTPVVAVATSTTAKPVFVVEGSGHVEFGGNAPTVTSCGGGSPNIMSHSNDHVGEINIGTITNTCTMVFNTPWLYPPSCLADDETVDTVRITSVETATSTVFKSSAFFSGDRINYICMGTITP